jgi:hypothetical protein
MARGTKAREKAKRREYAYEIYESREGSKKLRSISQKRYAEGDLPDNLIYSPKSPKEIQARQKAYSEGFIGLGSKTNSEDYADTMEWGQMGGRPRKWASNAERMRANRALEKQKQGQPLNWREKQLIGKLQGSYRPRGTFRPMTAAERKRKSRMKS